MTIRLSELATDWTRQTYEERLRLAAQSLYTHGFLSPVEYSRVDDEILEFAFRQREAEAVRP